MSETKFGVLASLLYMLAFMIVAVGLIFAVTGNNSGISALRVDATPYLLGAFASLFWGFVFHAFHTSTLRRDALLSAILEALTTRDGTRVPSAADGAPKEAWLIGQRQKR
jgi:hypothetical protein